MNYESRQQLIEHPQVQALYEGIVAKVNKDLAQYETIKGFVLVPDEFTIADGQLTASLKLRRRAVEDRYRAQIEVLYHKLAGPEGVRRAKGAAAEPARLAHTGR